MLPKINREYKSMGIKSGETGCLSFRDTGLAENKGKAPQKSLLQLESEGKREKEKGVLWVRSVELWVPACRHLWY